MDIIFPLKKCIKSVDLDYDQKTKICLQQICQKLDNFSELMYNLVINRNKIDLQILGGSSNGKIRNQKGSLSAFGN